jgi:hypothetical protein
MLLDTVISEVFYNSFDILLALAFWIYHLQKTEPDKTRMRLMRAHELVLAMRRQSNQHYVAVA